MCSNVVFIFIAFLQYYFCCHWNSDNFHKLKEIYFKWSTWARNVTWGKMCLIKKCFLELTTAQSKQTKILEWDLLENTIKTQEHVSNDNKLRLQLLIVELSCRYHYKVYGTLTTCTQEVVTQILLRIFSLVVSHYIPLLVTFPAHSTLHVNKNGHKKLFFHKSISFSLLSNS